MVAYWRQAGLSYIRFSAICARAVRAALKPQLRLEAEKVAESNVKITRLKQASS
ncbi:ATP synthase subunit epsilon, mitochondrial [Lepisosteus oculatus]